MQVVANPKEQAVIQEVEFTTLVKLYDYLKPYAERGEIIPEGGVDRIRVELKNLFKIPGTRFNELLFASVKRIGDEGNPGIYEFFKKRRPDGTPGMYYIPAWREKIGQAQRYARKVASAKSFTMDQRTRKLRTTPKV